MHFHQGWGFAEPVQLSGIWPTSVLFSPRGDRLWRNRPCTARHLHFLVYGFLIARSSHHARTINKRFLCYTTPFDQDGDSAGEPGFSIQGKGALKQSSCSSFAMPCLQCQPTGLFRHMEPGELPDSWEQCCGEGAKGSGDNLLITYFQARVIGMLSFYTERTLSMYSHSLIPANRTSLVIPLNSG